MYNLIVDRFPTTFGGAIVNFSVKRKKTCLSLKQSETERFQQNF